MDRIKLSHGSGGEDTHKLINDLFYKYFKNDILLQQNDSSIVDQINGKIAVTTDSFVINPIFFNGGDIGKLSVCGTVNDLCMSGATPLYITVSFIIEEGFLISDLKKIVNSIAKTCQEAKVKVVAGDTKVVEKGKCDKLYINTTGIGIINRRNSMIDGSNIDIGDKVILSGTIGDHGMSIMSKREYFNIDNSIKSDCECLNNIVKDIMAISENIKIMRDPTRGGLATTLNEIVDKSKKSILIKEENIGVKEEVSNLCEIFGIDPLYVANEGKFICIVSSEDSDKVLEVMRKSHIGKDANIIGEVINDKDAKLYIKTTLGATRIIKMLQGNILPRIC